MPANLKNHEVDAASREVFAHDLNRVAASLNEIASDGRKRGLLSRQQAEQLELMSDHVSSCGDVIREAVARAFPPLYLRSSYPPPYVGDWNPTDRASELERLGAMPEATGPAGVTIGRSDGTGSDVADLAALDPSTRVQR